MSGTVCWGYLASAGMTVVWPGQYVRVEWIGKCQLVDFAAEGANHSPPSKDYIPGTDNIDWGKERSRRIMWQREYCF
jgi:hypothetical protein